MRYEQPNPEEADGVKSHSETATRQTSALGGADDVSDEAQRPSGAVMWWNTSRSPLVHWPTAGAPHDDTSAPTASSAASHWLSALQTFLPLQRLIESHCVGLSVLGTQATHCV